MSISKESIDRIRDAADVVEVVSDYVSLKKKGQNHMACCPFHDEKSPSFSVSPGKGIYKCFGCGKSGDSIQFIMDIEGIGYLDSLKYLAKKYGIEIEDKEFTSDELHSQNERESLYIILNFAKNYFHDILINHEEGQSIGFSYFKERGFPENIINKFELGYSLNQWEALTKTAIEKNYKLEILEKAGLSLKRENPSSPENTYYDRFRGRVIFPIHNVVGKVIAFGARMLGNDKKQPKYINSPETEVYHKGSILYGIFHAKQAIRNKDNCYLVEGYTDVISMHLAGIENVVASSGTSLTVDQIKLISRYTHNITVLYDGDPAGIKASIRGIDLILEAGLNVSVVLFPNGEDPDSYSKKIGESAFNDYLKKEKTDFLSFKARLYIEETKNDPIKKAEVIREIVNTIAKIPDSIKRQVYLKQCSQILDIEEQVLISESNKLHLTKAKTKSEKEDFGVRQPDPELSADDLKSGIDTLQLHEREIMRLLINYGDNAIEGSIKVRNYLLDEVDDREFKTPLYKKMLELFKEVQHVENDISTFFITHPDKEISNEAIDLISSKYELSKNWEKFQIFVNTEKNDLGAAIYSTVIRLKWRDICEMIEENKENLKHSEDDSEVDTHLKIHMKLKEAEKEVATILGNVLR